MDYESPTAEQLESVVDSEDSDQQDGDENTSGGEDAGNDSDDGTNADGTGSEDAGGEDESGDGGGGSDGDDSGGEDTGDDDGASKSVFTHADVEYGKEELAKIIDDNTNNANWTKTNTEKAQAIATQADQIKGVIPLLEKVLADEDALSLLSELTGVKLDDKVLADLKEVSGLGTLDGKPTEMEVLRTEVGMLRFQVSKDEFRDDPAKFQEFIEFGTAQKAQSIDQAYTLWQAKDADSRIKAAEDATLKEKERADAAEKGGGKKNSKPAPTGKGAKKIASTFKPSKDGTYDDARNFIAGKIKDVFTD